MKALITGPRSGLTEDLKLPHLHIELDLEELPKRGDVLILNSGGSYTVTNIMWWVDGPENKAYWSADSDYEVHGLFQTVHVMVEPSGYRRETYTMDGARQEGFGAGRKAAARELAGRLDELERAGLNRPEHVTAAVLAWLAGQQETGN